MCYIKKMRLCMYVKCLACNTYTINGNYYHYKKDIRGFTSKIHLYYSAKMIWVLVLGSSHYPPPPPIPSSFPSIALTNDSICYFFLFFCIGMEFLLSLLPRNSLCLSDSGSSLSWCSSVFLDSISTVARLWLSNFEICFLPSLKSTLTARST